MVAGPSTPAFIAQQGSPVANGILLYEITWNTSQSGSAHTVSFPKRVSILSLVELTFL